MGVEERDFHCEVLLKILEISENTFIMGVIK